MQSFSEAGLPPQLLQSLERMQFTTPTAIQAEAIPPAMEGRDILGSAQTGTGKTAAFGIPLVAKLYEQSRGSALVLTPTRELAVQVMDTLQKLLGRGSGITTALLIGGQPMPKQFQQLRARPRVIVGTPGRINDHLERGTLMLHDARFLVLDETDRMLDLGFGVQLEKIARHLTAQRQTLMFSATLPKNIVKLSEKYLTNPVRISVGSTSAPVTKIKQETIYTTESDKYTHLLHQLETREGSILVFVKTKHGADRMAVKLNDRGHQADAIHGDLRQSKRDRVIDAFRKQRFRIMVATDVAARGLDIPHITHVINYDLPQCPEDYIHRIGRTARAGAEGAALNLLTSQDNVKWRAIQRLVNPGAEIQGAPHVAGERSGAGGGRRGNSRPAGAGKPRSFGSRDGARSGSREGARDGARSGPREGARDGARSGSREGARDGARSGPREGARDGARSGPRDGARDGARGGFSRDGGSRDGAREGSRDGVRAPREHSRSQGDFSNGVPKSTRFKRPRRGPAAPKVA